MHGEDTTPLAVNQLVNKPGPLGVKTQKHATVDLKQNIRMRQQAKNCARNNRMNDKQVAGM